MLLDHLERYVGSVSVGAATAMPDRIDAFDPIRRDRARASATWSSGRRRRSRDRCSAHDRPGAQARLADRCAAAGRVRLPDHHAHMGATDAGQMRSTWFAPRRSRTGDGPAGAVRRRRRRTRRRWRMRPRSGACRQQRRDARPHSACPHQPTPDVRSRRPTFATARWPVPARWCAIADIGCSGQRGTGGSALDVPARQRVSDPHSPAIAGLFRPARCRCSAIANAAAR